MKRFIVLILAALVLGFALHAEAALENRGTDSLGFNLFYDTDLDITWYDYSNNGDGSPWDVHNTWASGLIVNFGGTVYDDWRLPSALNQDGTGPCMGYDCDNSEMGHLYYIELGNVGYYAGGGLENVGEFEHLYNATYWSGTAETEAAWHFDYRFGWQDLPAKSAPLFGMAVRDGDVGSVPVVPEPVSTVLFLTGGAAMGLRRLRARK